MALARRSVGAVLAGMVVCLAAPAFAASVDTVTREFQGRKLPHIIVRGEMAKGDEKKFVRRALSLEEAIVVLEGPGGELKPGIEIGKVIRMKGFTTIVRKGETCESACALAWLGGLPAMMEAEGTIGFHAAWRDNDEGSVSSVGNARVGAYVNALGLPGAVVEYVTEAQPDDMKFLTFRDAKEIGLPLTRFVSPAASQPVTDGKPQRPNAPLEPSARTK